MADHRPEHGPRVLWLDDELDSDRPTYVDVWKRWLDKAEKAGKLELTAVASLSDFAKAVQSSSKPFQLLILDVMLTGEEAKTFAALGFPDERLLRLEGGAQLLGLLRDRRFDHGRPAWLTGLTHTPVVLLSSSGGLASPISSYLNDPAAADVIQLRKEIETDASGARPSTEFEKTITKLLVQAAEE